MHCCFWMLFVQTEAAVWYIWLIRCESPSYFTSIGNIDPQRSFIVSEVISGKRNKFSNWGTELGSVGIIINYSKTKSGVNVKNVKCEKNCCICEYWKLNLTALAFINYVDEQVSYVMNRNFLSVMMSRWKSYFFII